METIINLSIFAGCLLLISFLIYRVIKLNTKLQQLLGIYMQSEIDRHFLRNELERLLAENSTRELSESEGFVKFLSNSRDWAFKYIEQVQDALKEFDETITPITNWTETYGSVIEDSIFRNKIIEISAAYERLQSLLPKDTETPNN